MGLANPNPYPNPNLAAVVAVVQQRDVPVAAQLVEEGGERAGRLGELEADDALARDGAGAAAREVARVRLGEVVARDVRGLHLDGGERLDHLAALFGPGASLG